VPFSAAISEHPSAADAAAEVVGHVLEALGPAPDLVVVFATAAHRRFMDPIAATIQHVLQPGATIGATAVSIVGGAREVEEQPALSLWAARFAADGGRHPPTALHLDAVRTADGMTVTGIDPEAMRTASTMLLLADPSSFPVDDLIDLVARDHPGVNVIGGMASAGFGPAANALIADGVVFERGAVAVLLRDEQVTTVVSQGCRPIGAPLVVTRSESNVIHDIAGVSALARLDELYQRLPEEERELVTRGLHLGRVIDEHKLDFERGDFLVRNVVGADRATGSIAVGDVVDVGSTVQFHVRDASAADEDLRLLLAGKDADGALVFTCNGRGLRLFGEPDHDAELVDRVVRGDATAGMFCAGEIGRVGTRSFMHGFTASIALFHDRVAGGDGS
jgi:small ligand-binding sensory domain FIST